MAAVARSSVLLLALAVPTEAQEMTVRLAFAAEAVTPTPPALRWLRTEVLPRLPSWPAGLDPTGAFRLDGPLSSLRAAATSLVLPSQVCCAGELACADGLVLIGCQPDGTEDWWATGAARLPAAASALLARLRWEGDGMPRSFDPAALLGNLLPAVADGDPFAAFLQAAAANCGPVDVRWWRQDGNWRVRGRSDGGLALPALLLWLAQATVGAEAPSSSNAELEGWRLRASTARDGDRAEATRQVLRAEFVGLPILRALLHGDQDSRIAAIDGLSSLGSAADLPAIVAAADPSMPWVERLVVESVRTLWPQATAAVRAATRRRLEGSDSAVVRSIDLGALARSAATGSPVTGSPAPGSADPGRWRLFMALAVLACGLLGLWQRERWKLRALVAVAANG